MAPSLGALQDMLTTCEEYAASHNLQFSTDPDPAKCKTKLMAFLKTPRELPRLLLCGTPLPWVDKVKHLGNIITNTRDGTQADIKMKAAKFIDKNNNICQEFYFAHPVSKVKVNNIYNGHWTGSQLWKFGSRELEKLEGTYNRSAKLMFDLPLPTHRYFIEPMTGLPHLRSILISRYLKFINMIRKSGKKEIVELLNLVKSDVRTTTGHNLRSIMIQTGKSSIEDLTVEKEDLKYHEVPDAEAWRIDFLKEVVELRYGDLEVSGFSLNELMDIQESICTD